MVAIAISSGHLHLRQPIISHNWGRKESKSIIRQQKALPFALHSKLWFISDPSTALVLQGFCERLFSQVIYSILVATYTNRGTTRARSSWVAIKLERLEAFLAMKPLHCKKLGMGLDCQTKEESQWQSLFSRTSIPLEKEKRSCQCAKFAAEEAPRL